MLEQILAALENMRAPQMTSEYDLHALAAQALQGAELEFEHEASIAPRCRIDFLVGSVGIELKRGRPNASALKKQVARYLNADKLTAIIVIDEKSVGLPKSIFDKPVIEMSLQKLWGITTDAGDLSVSNAVPPDAYDDGADLIPFGALTGGEEDIQEQPQDILFDDLALSSVPLPPYMHQTEDIPAHYYGTLSYNRRARCWTIKGEPSVTEVCKRLFPATSGARRGEARFTAHRRIVGDVCWLMQRFPLLVEKRDEKLWQDALKGAQEDYRRRALAHMAPPVAQPPKSTFEGELKHFQEAGLAFLLMTPRALLADEMGLGKTVQAIAAMATLRRYPVLLVVPPHLIRNWQAELARFLTVSGHEARVHVLKGLKPYALPEADVYIVHYLLLRGWKQALDAYTFRMVIFDEIQELRRSGTEKYSAASLLSEKCERVLGLSGTPIYNQGGEIWNVVNILDFHFLGDFESFSREWCAGYGNNIVLKPDLLGDYLRREGLLLRRTKQEVLPELPKKRRLVQTIDADDALYQSLMRPVIQKLKRLSEDETLTKQERALLEGQISTGERQASGIAKAPFVCQFVRALVENGEKVLLFAHHHAVMDIYQKELKALKPVFITGRETGEKKELAVEKFMGGRTDLCCISLRAASGLNLQRASCVVFGELDWSPAVHSQAEDRAHRIGQEDSLLCYYLVSPSGSDSVMQEALGLKVSQFLLLMGDAPQGVGERVEDASYARRHVERLLKTMGDTFIKGGKGA